MNTNEAQRLLDTGAFVGALRVVARLFRKAQGENPEAEALYGRALNRQDSFAGLVRREQAAELRADAEGETYVANIPVRRAVVWLEAYDWLVEHINGVRAANLHVKAGATAYRGPVAVDRTDPNYSAWEKAHNALAKEREPWG